MLATTNARRLRGIAAEVSMPGYQPRDVCPELIYPTGLPAAASGTPTIGQCTSLVNALAPLVARYTLDTSVALRCVYKTTGAPAIFAGEIYMTPGGVLTTTASANTDMGTATTSSATEAVPVDVVIATPALIRDLAWRLAFQLASALDAVVLSSYASFSGHAPVGSGGSNSLTATNLNSIITDLAGLGEPIFLIVYPGVLVTSLYTVASDVVAIPAMVTGRYKSIRILVSDQVKQTGSSPVFTHNLAFTASALGFGSEVQATTNDSTHAQTVGTYTPLLDGAQPQLSVLLSITNTGSGNQTVTASCISNSNCLLTAANGVQVNW